MVRWTVQCYLPDFFDENGRSYFISLIFIILQSSPFAIDSFLAAGGVDGSDKSVEKVVK
jgi:hypothetical protein